ncbi:3D domain-containing protein [Phosphitispora fastidiosa]|uniref:3D domain-containing protein n=1 Tax=Phosphitispora fastidiosa TaxID=2837202 RepID=UPI002F423ADE|nr:3D (Asp-Asp-Asp) domain-containing protein [Phosphitispora fastidiosa]
MKKLILQVLACILLGVWFGYVLDQSVDLYVRYDRLQRDNGPVISLNRNGIGQQKPRLIMPQKTRKEPASRGQPAKVLTMKATAYNLTKNLTASGTKVCPGTVAVDPEVIPLGTRLYVEGYGPAIALDTGRLIKGNRIDVWFPPERGLAKKWGVKTVKVYIYGGR